MNLQKYDLNLLVALDVLLEEKHISKAAARMNLSQPAMSRMFARLKDVFDDNLLIKGAVGYELTPRAERLAQPLKDALAHVQYALSDENFTPSECTDTFNIYTLDFGEMVILPRLMEKLAIAAPGIRINLKHRLIDQDHKNLLGSADVAFGMFKIGIPQNCITETLFTDRFVCVMDQNHELAQKEELTLDDYMRCQHSVVLSSSSAPSLIDHMLKKQDFNRKIVKQSPHFMAALYSLAGTAHLQTVPKRIFDTVGAKFGLVHKELPIDLPEIQFGQAWHARHNKNPGLRWLLEQVKAAANDDSERSATQ